MRSYMVCSPWISRNLKKTLILLGKSPNGQTTKPNRQSLLPLIENNWSDAKEPNQNKINREIKNRKAANLLLWIHLWEPRKDRHGLKLPMRCIFHGKVYLVLLGESTGHLGGRLSKRFKHFFQKSKIMTLIHIWKRMHIKCLFYLTS